MLFLPQQPYLTLGSLRDQLLDALPPEASVSDARLLAVLQEVQLDGLLDRVGGLDGEQRDWANILTLGEQQILAFARLLLARPAFAFLDEATSALPPHRVQELYDLLEQTSTTYISVGSNKDLLAYHDLLLTLSGEGTWSVTDVCREPAETEWAMQPATANLQVG
jgi:putative ATP-binding cassette transporter